MKETHYKLKHRVTALFAAAVMLCSMLPGAAFAEEPTPQPTEETVQMEQQTEPSETDNDQTDESSPDPGEDVTEATPETAEEQPAEEEISAAVVGAELYTDLPNAPIGSYIGSEGLPVATGETKIGISEWPESQLEETSGSYLTAVALDNDGLTMAAPLLDGADYAIVPIMAQVEYPADGSSTDMILPDGVTLLDFYGEPALMPMPCCTIATMKPLPPSWAYMYRPLPILTHSLSTPARTAARRLKRCMSPLTVNTRWHLRLLMPVLLPTANALSPT